MANVTIYKDADVVVNVIDGVPPTDQSALVADLQAQVASLTEQVGQLQSEIQQAKDNATTLVQGLND